MAAETVVARPTPDEIKAAWPREAAKAGVEGVAGMRCRVAADGGVVDCAPLIEAPQDQGFAAALLTLVPKFRFLPRNAGQVVVVQASWPAWDSAADWPSRPALNPDAFSRVTGAGAALVSCLVGTDGRLSDCVIADAVGDPSVALAALGATKGVRLRPALSHGQPVPSIFTIPIRLGGR
jgi:outer membrane biosynthesis protein TonB